MLTELVKQEPRWQDGAALLVEAYAAAGRGADAVALARRGGRRRSASSIRRSPTSTRANASGVRRRRAYEQALQASPRNSGPQSRLRHGADERRRHGEHGEGAHGAARGGGGARQRRSARSSSCRRPSAASGDCDAAESDGAPSSIAQNARNARGFFALAEALEERRRYQAVVDALAPGDADVPSGPERAVRAVACCCRISGSRTSSSGSSTRPWRRSRRRGSSRRTIRRVTGYLIQAQLAAKKFTAGRRARASARADRTRRSAAGAARGAGAAPERQGRSGHRRARGACVQKHSGDPEAYIALAQLYSDANRGAQAVKRAAGRAGEVPGRDRAHLRARRRPREAEEVRRSRSGVPAGASRAIPTTPPRSTTSGYMLAERGERLDESVDLIRRALADRAGERLVPRQPRLGLLQERQARSRRGAPASAPPIS